MKIRNKIKNSNFSFSIIAKEICLNLLVLENINNDISQGILFKASDEKWSSFTSFTIGISSSA